MSTISVSEARAALPELLDRVVAGEEITVTRHGQPVAVIVRPDALRTRRAERVMDMAARLHDQLHAAAERPLAARPRLSAARAEELLADVRASRSAR
jgi:prevent-host-death family protein